MKSKIFLSLCLRMIRNMTISTNFDEGRLKIEKDILGTNKFYHYSLENCLRAYNAILRL
jgi:hypothetical protein